MGITDEYYGVDDDYVPGDHSWLLDNYEPTPEEIEALQEELDGQDPFGDEVYFDPDEYRDEE